MEIRRIFQTRNVFTVFHAKRKLGIFQMRLMSSKQEARRTGLHLNLFALQFKSEIICLARGLDDKHV